MADIVHRLREFPKDSVPHAAAAEIERLRARDYELRSGLHIARGALLGIGTDYSKEVAEHLAGVIDPALSSGQRE